MEGTTMFSYSLFIPVVFSIALTLYSCRNSNIRKSMIFGLFMLSLCIISITTALEVHSVGLERKLLFRNLSQIGLLGSPIAYLFLALDISGKEKYITLKNILLINSILIIALILIYTDRYHHLMRSAVYLTESLSLNSMIIKKTMLSKILLSYFQIITIVAIGILINYFRSIQNKYRLQVAAVIFCGVMPLVSKLLKSILPQEIINVMPVAFNIIPVGVILFWSIFKYNLFDVRPIARTKIIEEMNEGILVVDDENRVIDINRVMIKILNEAFDMSIIDILGYKADEILIKWNDWIKCFSSNATNEIEISYDAHGSKKYFKVTVSPILNSKGKKIGYLSLLNDITKMKVYEDDLRIKATKDGLTLINNKVHFADLANSYLLNEKYGDLNSSFLALDLDYFKKINDTYGHSVGDKALVHFVNICNNAIRKYDIIGRTGGEEFAVALPGTNIREALEIGERIRAAVENAPLLLEDGTSIDITVSIGAASGRNKEISLETIMMQADKALYIAKESGRNCIRAYENIDSTCV